VQAWAGRDGDVRLSHEMPTLNAFFQKVSNLELWSLMTTGVLHGLFKEPILGPLVWPWETPNLAPCGRAPQQIPVKSFTPVKYMLAAVTPIYAPHLFYCYCKWSNSEKRSIFGEVMHKSIYCSVSFIDTLLLILRNK